MRRLFVIRKDLNLSHGKLAAMVGHCSEAYFTNILKKCYEDNPHSSENGKVRLLVSVDSNVWNEYIMGIFTKTICECKNLTQLKKVEKYVSEVNFTLAENERLTEGIDYGYINDKCLTELTPENEDGTCTVGVWFRPLPDDIAHSISRKYMLYRG